MRTVRALPAALIALLAALALVVTGCSASAGDDSEADSDVTRTVATEKGDVTIPAHPKRVVVLNYALAGYLFDLDLPVVATTAQATDQAGEYDANWADKAEENGTELLTWSADGFDMESIIEQKPDLIVAGGIGFPYKHAVMAYDKLSAIAPTVIVDDELTTWQKQYEFLADTVFDKRGVYDEALAAYQARVAEVKANITVPEGESVFLSMLPDGRSFVQIEGRGLPAVFASLGFRPAELFATGQFEPYTTNGDSFELSTEQIGQVLTMPTLFQSGFNADVTTVAEMAQNPIWAALPSFKNRQAYDLPYWAARSDFDEAMNLLDLIETEFAKAN